MEFGFDITKYQSTRQENNQKKCIDNVINNYNLKRFVKNCIKSTKQNVAYKSI